MKPYSIISITLLIVFLIWFYTIFPSELKSFDNTQSIKITDRNGILLREILSPESGRSEWISLEKISPNLINATLAAEDERFYNHIGVDPIAIVRAAIANLKAGKIVSGGSTITQQLIRIIKPKKRTFLNKIIEAVYAVRVEIELSKDEILEQYLNRIPYGNQLFGAEAASRIYFDKSSKDISISEAALLAIVPRAPSAYNPYHNVEKLRTTHHRLIDKMHKLGKIDDTEKKIAHAIKIKLKPKRYSYSAPHFVEMIGRPDLRNEIKTTLDIRLQERIEQIIRDSLKALQKFNVTNAAVVVVDNSKGEILALAGSGDYFDKETSGNVNGALSLRQPGSTLKPFTYALALENGYTASSIIPDIEIDFPTEKGDYSPRNYDLKFRGPVRLRTALANSINVPAVHTVSKLGAGNLLNKLHKLGFESLNETPDHYGLGLTLGNGEVKLFELAAAYSTLARGGVYKPLSLSFPGNKTMSKQIFSKEVSYIISDILSDDSSRRISFGTGSPLNLPFKVAAKTGTSKNFRDNWTAGYTPEFTVAVWAGNFDASPMQGVSGITGAGPIFKNIFLHLAKTNEITWFEEPENIIHRTICPLSGKLISKDYVIGIDEIFIKGTEPIDKCDFHIDKKIDIRNGLLATSECESDHIKTMSFIELPYDYFYHSKSLGFSYPPKKASPLCRGSVSEISGYHSDNRTKQNRFKITHPNNETVYSIDPLIPRRLQTLYLKAEAKEIIDWFIDDLKYSTTSPPHNLSWQLTKGRHKISITSRDGQKNDEIEIDVR